MRRLRFLLFLPMAAYAAVACYWNDLGIYRPTGDEPHYLMVLESIVHDGDVDIENNCREHPEFHEMHRVRSSHGSFSVHNIGLPLLLAVPFAVGGTFGAKLALSLFMGLVPWLLFRAIDRTLNSPGWSLLVALTLSLGMPLLDGANQIYPDLPAGLLLFFAADYVIEGAAGLASSRARCAAFVAAVAFLPWLHIKLGLPALILLAGQLAACRGDGRPRKLAAALMLAGSLAALACYDLYAFDNLAGPYESGRSLVFDLPKNAMVFFGLHWDQAQGLFFQQPLLWLALLGLAPMCRGARWGLAWLAIVGAAVLLPNCLHFNWYGGYSFVGRFAWTSMLLWSVPVAHGARWLIERRRGALAAACLACLAFEAWLACSWLTCDRRLLAGSFDTPLWAYNSLLPSLRNQLPFWHRFDLQWKHPPNYTFLLLGAGLVASGYWTIQPRRDLLRGTWIVLVLVGVVIQSLPRPEDVLALSGAEVPAVVGQVEGQTRVAIEPRDAAGLLSLVPHLFLAKGDYLVTAKYTAQGNEVPHNASLFAAFGASDQEVETLQPTSPRGREAHWTVHVSQRRAQQRTEVGLIYDGRGAVSVERVSIERLRR